MKEQYLLVLVRATFVVLDRQCTVKAGEII